MPGNETNGLFYGNAGQVLIQLKAVAYTLVYSGIVSTVLLLVIHKTMGLRATERSERVGLDLADHAEAAYTLVD